MKPGLAKLTNTKAQNGRQKSQGIRQTGSSVTQWCPIVAVIIGIVSIVLSFRTFGFPLSERLSRLSSSSQPLSCDYQSFSAILPKGATVERVEEVQDGNSYGEGAANLPFPRNPSNLPNLCAVTIHVKTSLKSGYRFGIFLPKAWNSRLLVVGNGGWGGGINWLEMATGARRGMAALSTDTGHSSVATDSLWALNNTEKQADWGWRAMHGAVTLGKRIVTAYYATLIRHSYYSGCSTGGRQGLKELQISPDTFDGALIGAPAWWVNHLNLYILRVGLYNLPPSDPKHLSHGDIALVAGEVLRQCDGVDGVIDNIISAPELCKLDYDRLLCRTESKKPDCLTADQLRTVKDIHADWINPETKSLLHPGFSLSSEPQWPWVLPPNNIPSPYGTGYQSHFLLNTTTWSLSPTSPTPEALITLAESLDPGNATVSLTALTSSLRTFARRGGKLLLWHGLADGLIPAKSTHLLYNLTSSMLGSDLVHSFMRLFLIPGLQHCWNTPEESNAPWAIGGAYQAVMMGTSEWSVPGFEGDKRFDALEGLIKWVEEGELVDSVVATTWDRPMDPKSGVKRQRPICAWPRKAVWDGVGKVDEWQSWKCICEA